VILASAETAIDQPAVAKQETPDLPAPILDDTSTTPTTAVATPEKSAGDNQLVLLPDPPPAQTATQPEVKATLPEIEPSDWLGQQPGHHFTLQLAVTRSQPEIEQLQSQLASEIPSAIYRKQVKGKLWYCLIMGSTAQQTEIEQMKRGLPAAIRRNQPWRRQFAEVQRERLAGGK